MNEKLKDLYKKVILVHNNQPQRFEKRSEASYIVKAYNQICGDRFELYFDLENGRIVNSSFHGFGCAISKASSSVLLAHLEGKNLDEASQMIETYLQALSTEGVSEETIPEDFEAFTAAKSFPGRAKCATLSWDALQAFLPELK